jgi:F5/8 type C domain/Putative metal-binding motif
MAILVTSVVTFTALASPVVLKSAAQSDTACQRLPVSAISASAETEGFKAANVLDLNPATRWQHEQLGAYIQVDLGRPTIVCSLDIAWYVKDVGKYNFVISVSDNGRDFKDIVSAVSQGSTTSPERYNLPNNVNARYVRVTVNGNSNNDWAAINEMATNGLISCTIPKINDVTAKGNDGNVPQNTLDANLNTRWSNLGFPSWIQYDLGEPHPICNVDVAWYRGNFRVNTFTVSVSNDGINFTPVFSGQSSGQTIGLERYDVRDTMSRYVRITVTGNTENRWSSISEVRVNGGAETPPPPPSQEICGNGIDDNGNGQVDEGCPPPSQEICGNGIDDNGNGQVDEGCPPPSQEICGNGIDDNGNGQVDEGCPPSDGSGQKDPFGIQKIYPTKQGGEEWFMDMTDGKDPRSDPPSMTKNSDGSFKVTSTQVRYGTFTSSGYDPSKIETLDHSKIAQKGYMQSPNDWRDVEMTGYVKVNEGSSDENFAWYARGGRHTGDGWPEGCEGVAYKPNLFYDGRARFAKEQWHVSYVFTDKKNAMSPSQDKWVGFKGIMYNIQENGKTAVKMEIWVDKNNDGNWVKVDENIDRGGWGDAGGECKGAPDQIITWGGPIATFRWDGATDVDIKNFSVREIQPPQ